MVEPTVLVNTEVLKTLPMIVPMLVKDGSVAPLPLPFVTAPVIVPVLMKVP